jgi:ATP-binding cassette subfamily B protein
MFFNSQISRTFKLVWECSRKWTILLFVSQLLNSILPVAQLYLIKLIVDSLTENKEINFQSILFYIILFGVIQIVSALIENYQLLFSESQQQKVTDVISTKVAKKGSEIDLSYYENSSFYNNFHQAQTQSLHKPVQVLRSLSDLVSSGFLLISLGALLFYLHWGISLILIGFAIPIALVKWYFTKVLYKWEVDKMTTQRESNYFYQLLTTDFYAKEVRIFNLGQYFTDKFKSLRKRLFDDKYKINTRKASFGFVAKTMEIIAMISTFTFISWRTINGFLTIGDLVMFLQAFQKGQVAIQRSLSSIINLYNSRLFLTHLFDLLDLKSFLKTPILPKNIKPLKSSLVLENLNFTYPQTNNQVLANVNLEFSKGELIAFVGENGSGKTTLVKLLCRLYDPTSGVINWNGININQISLENWRNSISVIFQDFAKYQFTVRKNITLSDIETNESNQDKLEKASIYSGANSFIEEFDSKYDQMVGRWFKKGKELSGGQWQKLALSRAFYKSHAQLIILDEPTSSIDPLSEEDIFSNLKNIAENKIVIIVTHRLYNLKLADKIVVFDKGRIVQEGDHSFLIEKDGLYKEMFSKQLKT